MKSYYSLNTNKSKKGFDIEININEIINKEVIRFNPNLEYYNLTFDDVGLCLFDEDNYTIDILKGENAPVMLWYSIQKNNVIHISTDFDHPKINNDEVRAKRLELLNNVKI